MERIAEIRRALDEYRNGTRTEPPDFKTVDIEALLVKIDHLEDSLNKERRMEIRWIPADDAATQIVVYETKSGEKVK